MLIALSLHSRPVALGEHLAQGCGEGIAAGYVRAGGTQEK